MADLTFLMSVLMKSTRLSVSLPFLRYEMDIAKALDPKTVDERIERLDHIRNELSSAIDAVTELQREAQDNKTEAESLRESVKQLEQDKATAETLLKIPEESFARMLVRASSRGRIRGLLEGFVTGALSSLLVWYVTK